MYEGKLIFSQLMDFVPWRRFQTCVKRYRGDYKVKTYRCAEQFRVMAFAQLTYRHSLREIETCLRAVKSKLYHMGIHSTICHSNLAHANNQRDWRIYADFAQVLIQRAKQLYLDEDLGLDLDATVYALDASTIDLCLSLFPWAKFRKAKGAVKLHTLMNLQGSIPEFILISDGKLQCDQTVVLKTFYSFQGYPEPIRRIRYYDENLGKRLVFLTNNFELPATTIAALYKSRWQIEVFHAQCDEKDNLYRGGRWSYSGRSGVVEVGTVVPATQAFEFRRNPMRDVKEDDVVPPRARQDAISVCL